MYYINNWVYTTNHKRIAVNYFWFVILSGIVGMVLATVIRLEFAYPGVGVFAGDSIQYLSLASAHGVIMVFFMIMPLLFGAFSNFLLPTQLGVHDVAFPRLNSAAFWFLPGGLLMLCQLVCVDRRYQRMNCFNIREVQSLLKRKFFTDLINTQDSHVLLDKTAIGLRFKLNNISSINTNFLNISQFPLEFAPKSRQMFVGGTHFSILTNNRSYTLSPVFFSLAQKLGEFNFLEVINSAAFLGYALWDTSVRLSYGIGVFFTFFVNSVNSLLPIYPLNRSTSFFLFDFFVMQFAHLIFSIQFIWDRICVIYANRFSAYAAFYSLSSSKNKKADHSGYWGFDAVVSYYALEQQLRADFVSMVYELTTQTHFFFLELVSYFEQIMYFLFNLSLFSVGRKAAYDYFGVVIYPAEHSLSSWDLSYTDSTSSLPSKSLISEGASFFVATVTDLSLFVKTKVASFLTFADFVPLLPFLNFLTSLFNFVTFSPLFATTVCVEQTTENSNIRWVAYSLSVTDKNFFFFNMSFLLHFVSNFASYISFFYTHFFSYFFLINIFSSLFNFFFFNVFFFFANANLFYELNYFINSFFALFNHNSFAVITKNFFSPSTVVSDLSFVVSSFCSFLYSLHLLDIWQEVCSFFTNLLVVSLNELFLFLSSISLIIFGAKTNFFFSFWYSHFNRIAYFWKNFTLRGFVYQSAPALSTDAVDGLLFGNEETSAVSRLKKFENPVFKYDYKAGDYFPKLNKELYPHLFSTILNLTSGLRTAPWFFSNNLAELFEITIENFLNPALASFTVTNGATFSKNPLNKVFHTNPFYNFFHLTSHATGSTNSQWVSSNALNQKFYRMFSTSSMQQRIYSNWRQLKFSREAWRCKLLAARHQKTLFRRYLNEDGVFWSIERNAKDLIPGWAMITPFSSRIRFTAIGKTDIGLMGVLLVLNSSIISGANFLVTYRYLSTLNNRKIRDARAFFTEAIIVASWMMILANPMLAIGIIMLLSDRHWQTSFFDYSGGGDTVMFQHMFWFFGHPEVYIIIIPTFGFTNTMLSFYLRKRVSARASLLYSMYTIAFLGFFVWGHHMYMVGLAHTTRMLFSTLTVMISVPAATKIMHWCVTTVNSSFAMELPLLFTFTFIFFFVSGGISGMCVAHTGMDVLFHDTFYVIGHFHVMLAGGAMFASFGAFYFYFPAIFGVKFSRIYAYLHYTYYLIGQLMTVIPMFWLGYAGMPRRVLDYPSSFGGWHSVISAGHMLNVAGLMAFFIMIFDSLRQARAATRNTFGINRYNVRLNFYLYEIAKLSFVDQKSFFLYRYYSTKNVILGKTPIVNYEPYETVLLSYVFLKK